MPSGGKRNGSGRPKGALNKKPNAIRILIELSKPTKFIGNKMQPIVELQAEKRKADKSLNIVNQCISMLTDERIEQGVSDLRILEADLMESSNLIAVELQDRQTRFAPLAKANFEYAGFQLPAKIKAAKLRIINGESAIAGKRAALVKGGFTEAEAAGMLTDYDATADLAEIADLESIAEQWRLFAEFGLAEYLPSNAHEKLLVHQRYGDQPKLSNAAAMELLGISG